MEVRYIILTKNTKIHIILALNSLLSTGFGFSLVSLFPLKEIISITKAKTTDNQNTTIKILPIVPQKFNIHCSYQNNLHNK